MQQGRLQRHLLHQSCCCLRCSAHSSRRDCHSPTKNELQMRGAGDMMLQRLLDAADAGKTERMAAKRAGQRGGGGGAPTRGGGAHWRRHLQGVGQVCL